MARVLNQNPTPRRLTIVKPRKAIRSPLPTRVDGMTYHHIIPFCEVRDFWNRMVARDLEQLRETLVPALRRAMRQYPLVPAADIVVARADRLLEMIQTGNYVHDPNPDLVPDGIDDFIAIYVHMPGILFPGPINRPNDPGDGFDSFASRVVEQDRYVTALRAHHAIQIYLSQQPNPVYTADVAGTRARAEAAHFPRDASMALARVAAYTDMAAYDPARW
jgi:hypothetical protein